MHQRYLEEYLRVNLLGHDEYVRKTDFQYTKEQIVHTFVERGYNKQ